jgi:hypothetical protein
MTTKKKAPIVDQQISTAIEESFVWYEEPLLAEPEKTRHFSTREL